MDKEREIIHKILDQEAGEDEQQSIIRSMKTDSGVKAEFDALTNTVRLLKEGERREPPAFFTAEVMRKLPKQATSRSMLDRIREFLFNSHVLRWNMATALGTAVIVLVALVTISRVHREPMMNAAGPAETAVTVRLTFYSPQARTVSVAGDFNKWKTNADEMKNSDGMWSVNLKLKPGVYSYSFIVDGKSWVPDPGADTYEDDGFGSRNAVLRVAI
jgi:Glycogen recognition site of AMP-activated protein kinase